MAENYYPTAQAGNQVSQSEWVLMAQRLRTDGVVPDDETGIGELGVGQHGGGDMSVDMSVGEAFCAGTYYTNGTVLNLPIAANSSGSTRIDAIVIRYTFSTGVIGAAVLQGTPGAGNPNLTRDGTTWEVLLSLVTVASGAVSILNANCDSSGGERSSSPGLARHTSVVASAATITLPTLGRFMEVTVSGTASVTSMNVILANVSRPSGSLLLIRATGACTFVNGGIFVLAGDFVGPGYLLLIYDGGAMKEICRMTSVSGGIPWTTWTPVVTQSNVPTLTITRARYAISGKVVSIHADLVMTSAGTITNDIIISGWPAAINPAYSGTRVLVGQFRYLDAGLGDYSGDLMAVSATQLKLMETNVAAFVGTNPNIAIANTDEIHFHAWWEIA